MDKLDKSFGPRLFGHFDFTLLFEHSVMEIVPAGIILFVVPFYIFTLVTSNPRVRFGLLLWFKLGVASALLGLQINNVLLWCTSPLDSKLANTAAIMSCLATLCIGIMLHVGHVFFLHSPAFLSVFLTITMLLDVAITRTYFNRQGLETIAKVHVPIPILKLILVVLEEVPKRALIKKEEIRSAVARESLAGFWNRSLFFWVNTTLLIGFRSKITEEKLGQIDPQFDSEELHKSFARHWEDSDKQKSKFALLKACVQTVPWLFLFIIPSRLLHVALDYAQPFLLQEVVKVVGLSNLDPAVANGLIGATALVFFGKGIAKGWYNHFKNQIMTSIRGVLIGAIYHKSLKLDEGELGNSAAVTLMSTDVNGVERLISLSYESWARLLEVSAGIAVLGKFIGPSCLLVLIPAVLSTICSTRIAARLRRTRKDWNEHIEVRVSATSTALAQMKDIKMMGLAPAVAKELQARQDEEIRVSLRDRNTLSFVFALSALVETVTPAIVIAASIFSSKPSTLSTDAFFTTLAVVTMVTVPLAAILGSISTWATAFTSLSRIQDYLLKEELQEIRVVEEQQTSSEPTNRSTAVASGSTSAVRNRREPARQSRFAVQMNDVSITVDDDNPILRDCSINFPSKSTTMVMGAVGTGKSTLLKAILGEIKPKRGTIKLESARSVAYCGQVPWILNDTVQSNIVGANIYNAVLLRAVVWICALDVDLAQLPNGILTVCGSDGRNLSGGQKQRISLARALYDEAEIYLFDDIFSSLDTDTAATIRSRLFAENGPLKNATVIMVSNSIEDRAHSGMLLEVDADGRVREVKNGQVSPPQATATLAPESTTERAEFPAVKKVESPPTDTPLRQYGDFSLYSYYLGPAGWKCLTFWLVAIVFAAVGEKMPHIFVRLWLDRGDPGSRIYYIGFAILSVANPTLNLLATSTFFYLVNPAASKLLHWKLANTTAKARFDYIAKEDAGSLLNRYSQDISLVTQRLPLALLPASWMGLTVLIDVAIIAAGAKFAAPILPFFLAVIAVMQHFYLRTSRQLRILELDTSKRLYKHFTETTAGALHIRAYQWQPSFVAEFYQVLDQTQKPFYLLFCVQQWLTLALDTATAVSAVTVVAFAVNYTSQTSDTAMGLAFLSLITCSQTANWFIQTWVDTETCLAGVSRIREFANTTPVEKDRYSAVELPHAWPQSGKIEFNCVGAAYKASATVTHTVLENATVTIAPGQIAAITGRTGSGKTTMLLALLNLIEYSGAINIDGIEIGDVARNVLRSRITTITQSAIQLKGSVRYNLNPFDATLQPDAFDVTDELLIDNLRKVGLWDAISARGGLDADMDKMELSQGQKQLMQLARAIVHHQSFQSKVVLVDEGSSSMDDETEARMQKILSGVFGGCTILMVSHRAAALKMADCVLRLSGGQLQKVKPEEAVTRQSADS